MDVYLIIIGILLAVIVGMAYIIWRFISSKKLLVDVVNLLTLWIIDVYTTYGVTENEEQVQEFTNKLKEITKGI